MPDLTLRNTGKQDLNLAFTSGTYKALRSHV